jgi:hypothetical protein
VKPVFGVKSMKPMKPMTNMPWALLAAARATMPKAPGLA